MYKRQDEREAILAYENREVSLHEPVKVRRTLTFDGVEESRMVVTTVGRIIFNEAIPQTLGYVDRTNEEEMCIRDRHNVLFASMTEGIL